MNVMQDHATGTINAARMNKVVYPVLVNDGTSNVSMIVPATADVPPIPDTVPTFFPLK